MKPKFFRAAAVMAPQPMGQQYVLKAHHGAADRSA